MSEEQDKCKQTVAEVGMRGKVYHLVQIRHVENGLLLMLGVSNLYQKTGWKLLLDLGYIGRTQGRQLNNEIPMLLPKTYRRKCRGNSTTL